MLSVKEFYAESAWGLPFGAYGTDYTIVPNRHIGRDFKRTGDVPALLAGTVTAVVLTSAMAWCVELVDAFGQRLTYCHLANDNLPRERAVLAQGARVGRLARGPKTLALRDVEFPGTAWTGQHLHLVASRIARAAWTKTSGRVLSDFTDPTIIVRQVLAGTAGGGSTPFDPQEDDMSQADIDWMKSTLTGIANAINDKQIGILAAVNTARDHAVSADGKLEKVTADAQNAATISSEVRNWITDPNRGVLAAIGRVGTPTVDVAKLTDAIIAELRAEFGDAFITRLLDSAAKRLAG